MTTRLRGLRLCATCILQLVLASFALTRRLAIGAQDAVLPFKTALGAATRESQLTYTFDGGLQQCPAAAMP